MIQNNSNNNNEDEMFEPMELERLIGISSNYSDCLIVNPINPQQFIHSVGPSIVLADFKDSHSQSLLHGHNTDVSCLAISKCGSMLASGQFGSRMMKNRSMVSLWEVATKRLIHTFEGTSMKVHSVLFTPDSKFLIATDFQGLFVVWDVCTFETIFAKQLTNNDPNGKKYLSIDAIQVLKMETHSHLSSRHNTYTFLLSYDNKLHEWVLGYSVKIMEYTLLQNDMYYYPANKTFSRQLQSLTIAYEECDNSYNNNNNNRNNNNNTSTRKAVLAAATTNIGEIYLFDIANRSFIHSFQACSGGANACVFVNKYELIVGGGDGSISRYRSKNSNNSNSQSTNHQQFHQWSMIDSFKFSAAVSSLTTVTENTGNGNGAQKALLVTTAKAQVYRMDVLSQYNNNSMRDSNNISLLFSAHYSPVTKIAFGKHSHIFASISNANGVTHFWDLSNHKNIAQVRNISNGSALTFHNDTIIAGYENGSVICSQVAFEDKSTNNNNNNMSANVGKEVWNIQNVHRGRVNCLLICKTRMNAHQLLLTGGDDGILRVWNFKTLQFMVQYPLMIGKVLQLISDFEHPEFIHILGDNRQLVTFSLKRESIFIRRMFDKSQHKFGHITSMKQSKVGDYPLITCTTNGFIVFWDPELNYVIDVIDLKQLINTASTVQLSAICLSNSSTYLCCGTNGGRVLVLHATEKILLAMNDTSHSNMITDIAWTPDDKQIIASSVDTAVSVWNFYL